MTVYRRVGFLLFAAGWGANHFTTLLIVYRKELGLSPASLGVIFGAYALGLVPGLVLAGRASDARGRRAVVLPASVLAIGASAVLAFGSHGFGVLLVGRLLYGLAMGSVMSPGSVWIQELSPPALGPRRATLALSAGFGLGPLVSGVVGEVGPLPMILPYGLHAIVMGTALVCARAVPETAATQARSDDARRPADDRLARHELAVLAQLTPVAPWAFGFAAITMVIAPGILRPHVAHPVLYTGVVILTTLLSGVLVQPLTTRIGPAADLFGLGVGAIGILVAASAARAHAAGLLFVAAILVGAAYGLVITSGLREVVARVPGRQRGTVVGIYYVLTYVGFALPFLHARAAQNLGDVVTLQLTAAVACASLLVRAFLEYRAG